MHPITDFGDENDDDDEPSHDDNDDDMMTATTMMTTTAFWLTGMPPPEQPLPPALFCGWMRRGEANKEPKSKRKRDPKEPQTDKKSKDRSASGELHGKRTGAVSSPGPAVGGSPGLVDKKVPAQAGAE